VAHITLVLGARGYDPVDQSTAICAVVSRGQTMRSAILLAILLSAVSSAHASVIVCRGSISQEWGYLTITNEDGVECVVTRRVGMQTVLDVCGGKRCNVTGVSSPQEGVYQYVEGLIAVEIDPVQWKEPKPLGEAAIKAIEDQ
jgi:hypothetical protein